MTHVDDFALQWYCCVRAIQCDHRLMPTKTSDVLGAVNVLHVHTYQQQPMLIQFDVNGSDKLELQHLQVFPCWRHHPTTSCDHPIVLNCDVNAVVVVVVRQVTIRFDLLISCDCFRLNTVHLM